MADNIYSPPEADLKNIPEDGADARPTSVTVIAWILIVMAVLGLISMLVTYGNPMVMEMMKKNVIPVTLQYFMGFAGISVTVICSVAMLKGRNWGRLLYVGWAAFGMVVVLFTSPVKMMIIPSFIKFAIFAFFLFRPVANRYFDRSKATENA